MPLKPGQTTELTTLPESTAGPSKKRTVTKQYIPRYRSGAWAILRALETFPPDASITKVEIIRVAQPFCDSDFMTPLDNQHYTAWSSMKILLEKGYVYKNGNPPRFSLTDEGLEVAKSLVKATEVGGKSQETGQFQKRPRLNEPVPSFIPPDTMELWETPASRVADVVRPPLASTSTSASVGQTPRILRAGSYTIQFIMDNREIHAQVDRDRLEREIGQGGIDYSVRSLDVGDALWVAKCGSEEYVLDYIVERKRMDDLVGSIHDGRFHEQKV